MSFRFPFKTLTVMAALSYVLVDYPPLRLRFPKDRAEVKNAEFYPLSSFPMYSTFSDNPFHVYITDAAGKPLALIGTLDNEASVLKKTYELQLKRGQKAAGARGKLMNLPPELKKAAGLATLEMVRARPKAAEWMAARPDPRLRLHEVVLTAGDDGVRRVDTVVAEW